MSYGVGGKAGGGGVIALDEFYREILFTVSWNIESKVM